MSVADCCCVSSLLWLLVVRAGPTVSRQMVVIDTDPGVDDAAAIFACLGSTQIKLLALTCVRGNAAVDQIVINARKILHVAGYDQIPVYRGTNYGLVESPPGDLYFGADGLGDLSLPQAPSSNNVKTEHAASFLARIVQEHPGEVTIICLGPLTNIALALHLHSQFLNQAKNIVILGGSVKGQGNVAPGVEFNFYMDPHAAAFVLETASISNTRITLMPLETVADNSISWDWRWNTLGKVNNSVVSFLDKIDKRVNCLHPSPGYTPYDAYAAGVVFSNGFVASCQDLYGWVVYEGKRSQGALLVDYINITQRFPNLRVVTALNIEAFKSFLLSSLLNFT